MKLARVTKYKIGIPDEKVIVMKIWLRTYANLS
jgi:hypothetical protein